MIKMKDILKEIQYELDDQRIPEPVRDMAESVQEKIWRYIGGGHLVDDFLEIAEKDGNWNIVNPRKPDVFITYMPDGSMRGWWLTDMRIASVQQRLTPQTLTWEIQNWMN